MTPRPIMLLVRELNLGGCERDLTRIACGIDRSRFSPHVGCFLPNGFRERELRAAGVPVVAFPVRSVYSRSALRGAWQLVSYLRRHRIALVHAFDVPTNLFAVPAARLARVPAVVSSQLSYRSLAHPLSRRLLRVIDRLADRVVVNCQAMETHLVNDEHVPASRVFLCYNGVDTETFGPASADHGSEGTQPIVIGTVCALRPEKDLLTLLQAFARVAARHAGRLELVIVGAGSMLPRLEALRSTLQLHSCCRFEPATSDVARWMQAFDIYVLPSRTEAFPNALLEAMACGCAVVASRVGGIPELVSHGRNGLLFTPGDVDDLAGQLQLLIAQESLRCALGSEAARVARAQFPAERAVRRMEALYERLLTRRATRGRQIPSPRGEV